MGYSSEIRLNTEFVLRTCLAANAQMGDFVSLNGVGQIIETLGDDLSIRDLVRVFSDLVAARTDVHPVYMGPIIREPASAEEKKALEHFCRSCP